VNEKNCLDWFTGIVDQQGADSVSLAVTMKGSSLQLCKNGGLLTHMHPLGILMHIG
jgi:hypothetical protein